MPSREQIVWWCVRSDCDQLPQSQTHTTPICGQPQRHTPVSSLFVSTHKHCLNDVSHDENTPPSPGGWPGNATPVSHPVRHDSNAMRIPPRRGTPIGTSVGPRPTVPRRSLGVHSASPRRGDHGEPKGALLPRPPPAIRLGYRRGWNAEWFWKSSTAWLLYIADPVAKSTPLSRGRRQLNAASGYTC